MPNFLLSIPITNPDPSLITKMTIQVDAQNKIKAVEFIKWMYRNISGRNLKDSEIMILSFRQKSQIIANNAE